MTINEIAAGLGLAPVAGGEDHVNGVAIDSREAHPGCLFVCIRGSRTDGHEHAASAIKNGARAILCSRPLPDAGAPCLLVRDTVKALGSIAALWRRKCAGKVICITGTAGKTTLKEALASILSIGGRTASARGNHNNQIGLPCSLLNADGDERFIVLEAGISHAGDMDDLAGIARPDLAIILNVGQGHAEGLGEKGVAWHKARLLRYLAPGGAALVCADYPELLEETSRLGVKPELFSARAGSDLDFAILAGDAANGIFRLKLQNCQCEFKTPFRGEYGAEVALAAAAAATLLGLDCRNIQKGLAEMVPPPQRFRQIIVGGWHIFDDTYNANPLSMRRMLEAAAAHARRLGLPLIAVLGEMGELGDAAAELHLNLGMELAALEPCAVFWKGNFLRQIRAGLESRGTGAMPALIPVETPEEFARIWHGRQNGLPNPDRGAVVIFKGSRLNRLESFLKVVAAESGESHVL